MPSSVLWVGLVVVWLVVLMPMLINLRPAIRRTSDAALSARILHRGGRRPLVRTGPAAGHRSDPNWQPEESGSEDSVENTVNTDSEDESADGVDRETSEAVTSDIGEIDVDTEETESALGRSWSRLSRREHRGGFDADRDAAVQSAKFTFRQRVALSLVAMVLLTAIVAAFTTSMAFWATGISAVALGGYLMYLRSQVRLEQDIRRRRIARLQRSRLGVESRTDRELDLIPARLRRPGAVVLEIDDEDPIFDHLAPHVPVRAHELPRAAGQ